MRATSAVYLPHPNWGLPEFGTFKVAQVGYIRLGLGEVGDPGLEPGSRVGVLKRKDLTRPQFTPPDRLTSLGA